MTMSNITSRFVCRKLLLPLALYLGASLSTVQANDEKIISLIQLSDVHGNMLPHAGVIKTPDDSERYVAQRGGWYVGLANMTQKIDLDNRPFSSFGGRIVETTIGGAKLDTSKCYRFASCFPHGEPLDRICRTSGGVNHLFFELADADADDYSSAISLVPAVNIEAIITGTQVKQVLPDRFVHPVHNMIASLSGQSAWPHCNRRRCRLGRIQTVDSTKVGNPPVPAPVSKINPMLIQPQEGAGPMFFSGIIGHIGVRH